MIQPSSRVTSSTPMNPPISGQYMVGTLHAGVQRDLLAGRGERPRHLQAPLLAKHELQLAGRPQTLGVIGAVRRAGTRARYGTEQIPTEEAVLATDPRRPCVATRHALSSSKKLDLVGEHQTRLLPPDATTISGNRKKFTSVEIPANSGNFRNRAQIPQVSIGLTRGKA